MRYAIAAAICIIINNGYYDTTIIIIIYYIPLGLEAALPGTTPRLALSVSVEASQQDNVIIAHAATKALLRTRILAE